MIFAGIYAVNKGRLLVEIAKRLVFTPLALLWLFLGCGCVKSWVGTPLIFSGFAVGIRRSSLNKPYMLFTAYLSK